MAAPAAGCHASEESAADASIDGRDGRDDALNDDALPIQEAAADTFADAAAPDFDAAACAAYAVDGAAIEDASDGCASFRLLPCGVPPATKVEDCFLDLVTCAHACGTNLIYYCQLVPSACSLDAGIVPDAEAIIDCVSCAGPGGRRPRGLCARRATDRTPLGAYFGEMAHLEGASVRAFRDLAAWLTAHGAPPRLARAARRAEDDERRHARAVRRIAHRFGGVTPRPRVRASEMPALAELLEDDAVEGCVGETYGALLATWQAENAGDPRVRRTLARVAEDETRHAALAWEILAWGLPHARRQRIGARKRVRRAVGRALADLARRAEIPVDPSIARVAGHPAPEAARRLVAALARVVRADLSSL